MKSSRRGFLGGLVGAAALGPATLAEAAKSSLASANGLNSAAGTWGLSECSSMDYLTSLHSDLKRLQGLSKAEIREQYDYMRCEIDQFEVDALRSVSLRHKLSMMHERKIARTHQNRIKDLLASIARQGGL